MAEAAVATQPRHSGVPSELVDPVHTVMAAATVSSGNIRQDHHASGGRSDEDPGAFSRAVVPDGANPADPRRESPGGETRRGRWLAQVITSHLVNPVMRRVRAETALWPIVQVHFPARFKVLIIVFVLASTLWVANYFSSVVPTMEEHEHIPPCGLKNNNQVSHNARMLFVYFMWFLVARMSLFMPCVALRVALVQSPARPLTFCRRYFVHLIIRDGPLYIFVVGSLLFWFNLIQNPSCERRTPALYQCLKFYAAYSCMLSVLCITLAYWHNKLLFDAVHSRLEWHEPPDQSAPPNTIDMLQTVSYDRSLFGDEDGRPYPAECAICLGAWEEDDVIKTTHCMHAFHKECIGNWLRTARTCALCREDLTKQRSGGTGAMVLGSPQEV